MQHNRFVRKSKYDAYFKDMDSLYVKLWLSQYKESKDLKHWKHELIKYADHFKSPIDCIKAFDGVALVKNRFDYKALKIPLNTSKTTWIWYIYLSRTDPVFRLKKLHRTRAIQSQYKGYDIKPAVVIPILQLKSRKNIRERLKKEAYNMPQYLINKARERMRILLREEKETAKKKDICRYKARQERYNRRLAIRKRGDDTYTPLSPFIKLAKQNPFNAYADGIPLKEVFTDGKIYYNLARPPFLFGSWDDGVLCRCGDGVIKLDMENKTSTTCLTCGFSFKLK